MKEQRILRVFGNINGQYVNEAETSVTIKRRPRRAAWMGAAAAVLAAAVLVGLLLRPDAGLFTPTAAAAYEPDYTIPYDGTEPDDEYLSAIRAFAANAGASLLDGNDTTAYSPAALYTALSMVSELADGESLEALLKVLEADGTAVLRQNSGSLWRYLCANPNMKKPGVVTMANSMWLNGDYTFNGETLQNLADNYYVAGYTGDMKKDIPALASDWVKKQTHDLLDCRIRPEENTVAVLLSAIYFYDEWEEPFNELATTDGSFLAGAADGTALGSGETIMERVRCNYMRRTQENWEYYRGSGVTASAQYFRNGGKMLFILPDEGNSPADVLSDTELLSALLDWEESAGSTARVEWSIPRFTMKKTLDLEDGLTALGLGELFDTGGDPLPRLSDGGASAYIGRAEQGTAISIDEKGCEAASYAEIEPVTGDSIPPEDTVYMTLHRPFVFAVLSENDVPLFLGVICDPNG